MKETDARKNTSLLIKLVSMFPDTALSFQQQKSEEAETTFSPRGEVASYSELQKSTSREPSMHGRTKGNYLPPVKMRAKRLYDRIHIPSNSSNEGACLNLVISLLSLPSTLTYLHLLTLPRLRTDIATYQTLAKAGTPNVKPIR